MRNGRPSITLIQLNNAVYAGGLKVKMLKELKGKKVRIHWFKQNTTVEYRLEDYCEMKEEIWIKVRLNITDKDMIWFRFCDVESIGRVP